MEHAAVIGNDGIIPAPAGCAAGGCLGFDDHDTGGSDNDMVDVKPFGREIVKDLVALFGEQVQGPADNQLPFQHQTAPPPTGRQPVPAP